MCPSLCIFVSIDCLWWEVKWCGSLSPSPVVASGRYSFIWMCPVRSKLYRILCMHPYIPDLSIILACTERQRHQVPIVLGALYSGTTKQLHQGCDLESAFLRPPLSQWLMELCLRSLEITGKMWIRELFNLLAKFSAMPLKPRQICLEWFLLLAATRVIELKDIRYTSKWKTTSSSNAFQKNPKASYSAKKELTRKCCLSWDFPFVVHNGSDYRLEDVAQDLDVS